MHRYSEAEALLKSVLRSLEKSLGAEHPDVAVTLANLAGVYCHEERYTDAERLYLRSLAILEKSLGATHPTTANLLDVLAWTYYMHGRYEQAEPLYRRSWVIQEDVFGPDSPNVAGTLWRYQLLLQKTKRKTEAKQLRKRAESILARLSREDRSRFTVDVAELSKGRDRSKRQ